MYFIRQEAHNLFIETFSTFLPSRCIWQHNVRTIIVMDLETISIGTIVLPMLFDELFSEKPLTVTEFTRFIKTVLENESGLSNVWVEGEISNFTRATSGHLYFTIKDQGAALPCVMWRTSAARARDMALREGVSIQVHGSISLYEPSGKYQLVVDLIKPAGEGALYAKFAKLKAQLESEGLFDPSHKRPLPASPRVIGVVTSETGAAYQDILNTLKRRMPLATVVLAHAQVQGAEAPASILRAISVVSAQPDVEVLLLARGGGSIEDLWCFNDEAVVRAVAACPIPVITGVGHEIDFTLVDFASDMRAPTPTAAAELATPITIDQLRANVDSYSQYLFDSASDQVDNLVEKITLLRQRLGYLSPEKQLNTQWQKLDELTSRLGRAARNQLTMKQTVLTGFHNRLAANHPKEILKRGFSILRRAKDGKVVKLTNDAPVGTQLDVFLSDGQIHAVVNEQG